MTSVPVAPESCPSRTEPAKPRIAAPAVSLKTVLRGDNAGTTLLGEVEPQFIAPAVSQRDFKSAHILTVGGPPGSGAGTLYVWTKASGEVTPVADIIAYQVTDPDPDDQEDNPTDSNPYGVASLEDGSALVADAAGNDLLRVWPNGDIVNRREDQAACGSRRGGVRGRPGLPAAGHADHL